MAPLVVTHSVRASQQVVVEFKIPHTPPQQGEDRVVLSIDGAGISMNRGDWTQFVNCVIKSNEQVSKALDIPGRYIGQVS